VSEIFVCTPMKNISVVLIRAENFLPVSGYVYGARRYFQPTLLISQEDIILSFITLYRMTIQLTDESS
jgi:hypothetical protein